MSTTKPARRYIAEPRRLLYRDQTVWGAYWAFPGMVPAWVMDAHDPPRTAIFDLREDAEEEAKIALANALLSRFTTTDLPERYRHIQAADFAADLKESGITPTQFARVYGISQDSVMSWINGIARRLGKSDRIPHAARVMLALFLAYPDAIEIAERVTAENTTPRHEFAEEASSSPG